MYLTLLMPTTTIEVIPHVTLPKESWLARAFYTSGSKKVVWSCLQDLDLLFEWHMNFLCFVYKDNGKAHCLSAGMACIFRCC